MLAIIAVLCFGLAYAEHAAEITVRHASLNVTGLTLLGLLFLALHFAWPSVKR